ncbi:MAG: glycoside hydrolase family 130 protein [Deltaproteobacteria bacterium]|nr:glycoside hydrolase family 130 protein [Deltaproteobacteria bacterium]
MFQRCENNPVICPSDVKPSAAGYRVVGAFNPGATLFNDETILLLRVAESCIQKPGKVRVPVYKFYQGRGIPEIIEFDDDDPDLSLKDTRGVVYKGKDYLSSISHLRLARSFDGINFTIEPAPFICPCSPDEEYGTEDARIVCIDGTFYINYTIISTDSWCTALATTTDFKEYKKEGIIFHPENKDVAIFPEKINDKYIALHRPNNSGFGKASIWYAESHDLLHWGNHKCIARPRNTVYESMKIGGGSAPIKTDEGWLSIYHAKGDNSRYSLFAMLLDLERPWKVTQRGTTPLLEPENNYETNGFFGNVVFTNGIVIKDGQLFMYYGSSDETTCLAVTTVEKILAGF